MGGAKGAGIHAQPRKRYPSIVLRDEMKMMGFAKGSTHPTRWLDLQRQYDIGVVEREKGAEIAKRERPADAA